MAAAAILLTCVVPRRMIALVDAWSVIGGVGSAVAAGAAVVAIVYARRTVNLSKEILSATISANDEAIRARATETAERRKVLAEEIRRQRLAQIERVAEIVSRVGDLVRTAS